MEEQPPCEAAKVGTVTAVKVEIIAVRYSSDDYGFDTHWRDYFTTVEAAELAVKAEMVKLARPIEWSMVSDYSFILDDGDTQYQSHLEVIRTRD